MAGAQHDKKITRVRVKDSLVEPFVAHYQVRGSSSSQVWAVFLTTKSQIALEKLRVHFATGRKDEA